MSLWAHLNQMDQIKQVFLKHPDLFEGCGFCIIGTTPSVYLGANIPQEKRIEFASKFPFLQWKRKRGYGNHYNYVTTYEGIDFNLDDAEKIPALPEVDSIVVFSEREINQPKESASL